MSGLCMAVGMLCLAEAVSGFKTGGDEIFGGSSTGGSMAMASVWLELSPLDETCLHGARDWVDFTPVFTPAMGGLALASEMLEGFSLNSNGTLRLSLGCFEAAYGSVSVGVPPLDWGGLYAEASIHRCQGGMQEMCYACGRLHGSDGGVNCSHAESCAARGDPASDCTCPPLFVKVNWDDDGFDGDEDRNETSPSADDDELVGYRALGITGTCWCHSDELSGSHVSGLTASSELRLWEGSVAAASTASDFEIEAVSATAGIGTGSFQYNVHDATNGFLRTVTRHVTAANLELRPDWDDDGAVDADDRHLLQPDVRPERWQVRVRETPYRLRLVSECPAAAALALDVTCTDGIVPAIVTPATGAPVVPEKNTAQDVWIDTSAGAGDVTLAYTLGVAAAETNLTDTLLIHVVDTTVEEKWIPAASSVAATYDYSDVDGDVWWEVWRVTDDGYEWIDGDCSSSFTLENLAAGDYEVCVYFDGLYEDGWQGYYTSGSLHAVDVRLDRLYETANPANFIFNPTPKDDYTDKPVREEVMENGWLHTYGTPRNNLYVVARTNENVLGVTVHLCVIPSNSAERVICAACYDGCIMDSCTLSSNGVARLEIPIAEDSVITNCMILVGLDLDADGMFAYQEGSPLEVYRRGDMPKFANVVCVSKEDAESKDSWIGRFTTGILGAVVRAELPIAGGLLSVFYTADIEDLGETWSPTRNEWINFDARAEMTGFTEWLTHNAGADFSLENYRTTIRSLRWDPRSQVARRLAKSPPFAPWTETVNEVGENPAAGGYVLTATGRLIMQAYENELHDKAARIMEDEPDGTVLVFSNEYEWNDASLITNAFPSMSPGYVDGTTISLGSKGPYGGILNLVAAAIMQLGTTSTEMRDADAFYAVGRGRMTNPSYWISARKSIDGDGTAHYDLYQVGFACTVSDLYDFNYEDGELSCMAATLQLGYGRGMSGRSHGVIFRHEILINEIYTNPFAE